MRTIVILILFCFNSILGQETSSLIFSDSLGLEKIVITSTRMALTDPLTFQNISRDDIESINIGQDPTVLIQEMSPSIVSYSDGGTDIGNYSQFRLRGIDQSRINMTMNGVPLNDMVDHGVYFSNFSDFGNSIQSIQVQRGAGASIRGVASYGGAVNFESINLFGDLQGEGQVTLGSFGTLRTAAELGTGLLENNTGFYGRITRTETEGYKYNSGSDSYSMFFSAGKLGEDDLFKVTAFSGKTQNGQSYEHVPLSQILIDPKSNYNDLNDVDDFEQYMVQVLYARNPNDKFNYHITGYYNGAGGVFPYSFGGDQYMYGLENDHFGIMVNGETKWTNNQLSAGLHTYIFDRTNFEYVTPLVTEPYTRDFTDKSEFNAFVKYSGGLQNLKWYGNFELRTISMDMKGDEFLNVNLDENNSWTFYNGVIGMSYIIDQNTSIYSSLAKTSREPTRSDILNGVDKAETVTDLEFGWRYRSQSLDFTVNAFFMNFEDEITKIGALQERSYIEIRQNVDRSTRNGFEAQLNYKPSQDFSAALTAAYMYSNIENYSNGVGEYQDVDHIFAPKLVFQPVFKYSISKAIRAKISGRYVSNSFTELSNNEEFILPSHFILNLQADIRLTQRLSSTIMLNNALNKLYYTDGAPIDADFDGISEDIGYRVQPPRHFYVMMKYKI